jgi:Protein of unknown function (DUF3014)
MALDPEDLDLDLKRADEAAAFGDSAEGPSPIDLGRAPGSGPGIWLAALAGVLLVGGGVLWLLRPRPATSAALPRVPASSAPAPVPTSTPVPLVLPPLDGSDGAVRDLAKAISAHPLYALWLAQKELIRAFAAVVVNVAEGESPRAHLGFLAPKAGFAAIERRSGRLLLDPASYARYDAVGDAAATLDPEQCARVYHLLEPLFESAYRELGHAEGGFSKALQVALRKLLEVPLLEGEVPLVRVEKVVVVYEFFDERVEALSIPQKHLARMGPHNVARIQDKARAFAQALGWSVSPIAPAKSASPPGAPPAHP